MPLSLNHCSSFLYLTRCYFQFRFDFESPCTAHATYDTVLHGLTTPFQVFLDLKTGVIVTGEATLTLEQDSYSRPLAFGAGVLSEEANQSRFSDRRLNLPS